MSRENVETLRRGFEAFNSGDLVRILAFAHPDFETEISPELSTEPDVYRGHDGIRRYFRTFQDAMDEIRFEPERFWDVGESVVATVRVTARGRQSEIWVEQQLAQVWTIRDGRAFGLRTYGSLSEALGSVGLRE